MKIEIASKNKFRRTGYNIFQKRSEFRYKQISLYFDEQFDEAIEILVRRFEDFQLLGSGYVVDSIDFADLYTAEYSAIGGSSYIPIPLKIANRQAALNIKNERDVMCFLYCIAAYLHPCACTNNAGIASQYRKYFGEFDITGLTWPMTVDQLYKFERQNPQIGVNVLTIDENGYDIVPLYTSKFVNQRPNHVCLLLFSGKKFVGEKKSLGRSGMQSFAG